MTGYKFKFLSLTNQGEDVHSYTSPVYSGIDTNLDPIFNYLANREVWAPALNHWNNKVREFGTLGHTELRVYSVVNGVETLFDYGSLISSKEFLEAHNLRPSERMSENLFNNYAAS